jgi:hypothetical protein
MGLKKKTSRLDRKTGVLFLIFFIVIAGLITSAFIVKKQNLNKSSKKASLFKIIVTYNLQKGTAFINSVSTVPEGNKTQDPFAIESPYKIKIADKNNLSIFEENVLIKQNIYIEDGPKAKPGNVVKKPNTLTTTLFIPYKPEGIIVELSKNNRPVASFVIPDSDRRLSLVPTPPVAKTAGGNMTIAVIGDGLSAASFNTYYNNFLSYIKNTAPYGDITSYVNFVPYNNPNPSSCNSTIVNCLEYGGFSPVENQAQSATGTNRFVILYNGTAGDPSATYTDTVPSVININNDVQWAAIHEFLGHMVGNLNDRYPNSDYNGSNGANLSPSNCSTSAQGLSWWSTAGAQPGTNGYYLGCETTSDTYSPFPNQSSCSKHHGIGNSSTIMADCGGVESFDSVERYYIQNCRMPILQGGSPANFCGGSSGDGGGENTSCIQTPGSICQGVNLYGGDFYNYNPSNPSNGPADCQYACNQDQNCLAWTYQIDNNTCWEKNSIPQASSDPNTVSGLKGVGGEAGHQT